MSRALAHLCPLIVVFLLALSASKKSAAGEVHVAVAANFTAAAKSLAAAFEAETGHQAVLSFGSTGKLFTQIAYGAPYQVFLAADAVRPERAEHEGLAVPGTRFTYAVGRLALFSRDPDLVDSAGHVLKTGTFAKLAVANPKTAPYGAAAIETLKALNVYEQLRDRLVRGDNIAQTHQFVVTGNADLGFVALTQIKATKGGSHWVVPDTLHSDLRQDAVLLKNGADDPVARAFLNFLKSDQAARIIEDFGYGLGGGSKP